MLNLFSFETVMIKMLLTYSNCNDSVISLIDTINNYDNYYHNFYDLFYKKRFLDSILVSKQGFKFLNCINVLYFH
jgi:hypothetical protein